MIGLSGDAAKRCEPSLTVGLLPRRSIVVLASFRSLWALSDSRASVRAGQ